MKTRITRILTVTLLMAGWITVSRADIIWLEDFSDDIGYGGFRLQENDGNVNVHDSNGFIFFPYSLA